MNIQNTQIFQKKHAFTLVELVIVITILAILSTIGWVTYQSSSQTARDGSRLQSLIAIKNGVNFYSVSAGKYPALDKSLSILAGGTPIAYQGVVDESFIRVIAMSSVPLDPLDHTPYIYATNSSQSTYKILALGEGSEILGSFSRSYAMEEPRKYLTYGEDLGILLHSDQSRPTTDIDLASTTGSFLLIYGKTDVFSASGNALYSNFSLHAPWLLKDFSLASNDHSLVGLWDFHTLSGTSLKDFSLFHHDALCYDSGAVSDCSLVSQNGKFYLRLDGVDDRIDLGVSDDFRFQSVFLKLTVLSEPTSKASIVASRPLDSHGDWRLGLRTPQGLDSCVSDAYQVDSECLPPVTHAWTLGKPFSLALTQEDEVGVFVSGQKISSFALHATIPSTHGSHLVVGGGEGGFSFPNIDIEQIRIYNRLLTPQEIATLHRASYSN